MEIPWSEVQEKSETVTMRMSGGPAPNIIKRDAKNPRPLVRMLKPGEPDSKLAVDGILFAGIRYIDVMLHIQTTIRDYLHNDNQCELFLTDQAGNKRYYDYKVSAVGDSGGNVPGLYL